MKRYLFSLALLAAVAILPSWAGETKKSTATTIPVGTLVHVRVTDDLSSETAQPGDTFRGVLETPLEVNGKTVYPRGSSVTGRVRAVESSGRLSHPGLLELELIRVESGGKSSTLSTEPCRIKGKSHTKSNVTKVGGGAAAGAIIGAIAGGGKGAAIGAGVGAAAGTGVAAATGKQPAKVESEAVLTFTTAASATATTSAAPAAAPASSPKSYDDESPEARSFSARDRRVIRNCFVEHASELPPGLAKRETLPPGLERQMERNRTLPPGLQKRVQPLPQVCESQLARLPRDLERVVYNRRVMLINADYLILDAFDVDTE
ncbi:MAG: hypothetical protein ACRD2K_00270 [Terriglobales bacterium]